VPPDERGRLRPLDLLVIRPSVDLGQIADNYTLDVGPMLGAAFRALQAREGGSPDWLSMLLFTPDYIDRLVEIGYNDARRQHDTIERFFQRGREAVGASAVSPEPET
jgi:NTE family protein